MFFAGLLQRFLLGLLYWLHPGFQGILLGIFPGFIQRFTSGLFSSLVIPGFPSECLLAIPYGIPPGFFFSGIFFGNRFWDSFIGFSRDSINLVNYFSFHQKILPKFLHSFLPEFLPWIFPSLHKTYSWVSSDFLSYFSRGYFIDSSQDLFLDFSQDSFRDLFRDSFRNSFKDSPQDSFWDFF